MTKRDDDDEFERDYARLPASVWRHMKRAATGELRRERARRGGIPRDEEIQEQRERDHRRGHGAHDREPDGKRKREM